LRSAAGLAALLLMTLAATACEADRNVPLGQAVEDVVSVGVEVGDNFFEPSETEVETGDAVDWRWVGAVPHNVSGEGFSSPTQTTGTFEHVFTTPGTFAYVCTLHPEMTGTIVVTGEATGTTPGIVEPQPVPEVVMQDASLQSEVVVDGLDQPTAIAFLDDDLMLVTEKTTGKVRIVRDGAVEADAIDLAVNNFDERGLLGITVHPQFPDEPYVYLHWTWRGDGDGDDGLLGDDSDVDVEVPALGNRVDRFRWTDEALVFDRNIVEFPSNTLVTDTSGRVRGNHDAGPLTFGPDGMLYVMIGDQNLRGQLQNIPTGPEPDDVNFAGVILRLHDDGTIPDDNPFYDHGATVGGEVGENLQMIHTYGVRNSFGLAFEPTSGSLWQTENGDDSFDEVNVFAAGSNSGWIQVQGPPERFEEYAQLENDSEDGLDVPSWPPSNLAADVGAAEDSMLQLPGMAYAPPVLSFVYPPALTAIGFSDDRLGASSAQSAWFGTVLSDALLRFPVSADGRSLDLEGPLGDQVVDNTAKGDLGESADYVVGTGFGVVTDIEQGPDGALYIVSLDAGVIRRLTPA
jgi:glucose/arabinose dehydrogenase